MSRNKKTYRKIREVLKGIISNMGSVILILALCTIVIAIIINWESAVKEMQRFIKVIMPFIFGLVLAFLIILFAGVSIAFYILAELIKQATEYKEENELTI